MPNISFFLSSFTFNTSLLSIFPIFQVLIGSSCWLSGVVKSQLHVHLSLHRPAKTSFPKFRVTYGAALLYPMKWELQRCINPPTFLHQDPAFLQLPRTSSTTILNNPSSTTVQAVKSRRCPNVSSMIATTTPIIRTLLIMCGKTILLPMIGPHS